MVRPETSVQRRLSRAFQRIAATLDPLVGVHRSFCEETRPDEIVGHIARRAPRPWPVMALRHPGGLMERLETFQSARAMRRRPPPNSIERAMVAGGCFRGGFPAAVVLDSARIRSIETAPGCPSPPRDGAMLAWAGKQA